MMFPFGLFGVSPWVVLAMLGLGAPQSPDVLKRVDASFDKLEARLIEQPDVTGPLTPGREQLAFLIKKYPRAARSWQLSPSLAVNMTTDEIFRFVTWRANSILACGTAALSREELRKEGRSAGDADSELPLAPSFWEGPTIEGPIRISPDCSKLLDEGGQPYTVATRADLQACEMLLKRFNRSKSPILPTTPAASQRLRRNLEYLRSEQGGRPEPEPRIEGVIREPTSHVFSRQVFVFRAFMKSTATEETLVLLVPLSV
jgi:hypothetical protein